MTDPYSGYQKIPKKPRINKKVGIYAGVLALALISFALGGAIWGVLRPSYSAYIEDAETASLAITSNVEFSGFVWFAIGTGIIAAALALIVFLRSETSRGIMMLLWLGVVSFIGSAAFLMFGSAISDLIHPHPEDYAAAVGESFQIAPNFDPGVGLFAAPFLAVCMYWCAAFVTPESD